jgi:predicted helicase
MRERYLDAFDRVWIDNLHGDRKISERAPDGRSSETVFKVQGQSPGIRVGTGIALLARTDSGGAREVQYRDFHEPRAEDRRAALLESAEEKSEERAGAYTALEPRAGLGYPLKPRATGEGYFDWPKLLELFPEFFPGVTTSCDDSVVDTDHDRLAERMKRYFDPNISNAEIADTDPRLMRDVDGFDAEKTRDCLQKRGFKREHITRYQYRPMDVRWLYWEPKTELLDRERTEFMPHVFEGNLFLAVAHKPRRGWEGPMVAQTAGDYVLADPSTNLFPLKLNPDTLGQDLFSQSGSGGASDEDDGPVFNLSHDAEDYLAGLKSPSSHAFTPPQLFFHTLAVLHAPAYGIEHEGALRQDWPRVPLPAEADALRQSAALGRRVAALLNVEQDVDGVTAGSVREALRPLAAPVKAGGGQLDPSAGDLAVTAGWGYTIGTTVMPNNGEIVERPFTEEEQRAFPDGYEDRFGTQALDLYLNERAYWQGVPQRVWDYTLGGYPVLKKWLSYREKDVLGRALGTGEVRHFAGMARRIAALLLLEPELDENYVRARSEAVAWEEITEDAAS